ncbi:theronine dehydrogenase-like Zn-dependent dehydrogenase [Thermus oshimai JL-2]|uniref:Theronine dehydrogenase-like Zn-dependent dehydrogenase n=1 Tax=Thermus oshimai JL-2 TaxID=751945 RepID=K7RJH0_THEOS|nr:alcohol dehydrogenase family protein [Thermus oshimai]AFV76567.1 theronine dehydrogenase-like Zn-dependent dehydrogenase [Thermus oshimai JL-2]
MRAVLFQGVGRVEVGEAPEPQLETPWDAIVRVEWAGICGSDLHLYHGKFPLLPGSVLGHEFVGVVEALGEGVRGLEVGTRVVGTFHVACGVCPFCRRGEFHLCERRGVYGYGPLFGNLPGTQAERVRVPFAEVNLRPLPQGLPPERALFAGDILATAYGALKNTRLKPGERVAVVGAGPVGLMAVEAAFVMGASKVLAVDRVEARLSFAEGLGAIPVNSTKENPVRRVREETDGEGADVVVEAVGGTATLALAFELVRPGGRISAVGVDNAPSFPFPLSSGLVRDISFRLGLANVHRHLDELLALLATGRLRPEQVVSHTLPLEEAAEGYRLFDTKEALKVLLKVG